MIDVRIQNILNVVDQFSGVKTEYGREPKTDLEQYILKSMWVMMLSEFEGSIKELAENYLDKIKGYDIKNIHTCILLTHFEPKNNNSSSVEKLIDAYQQDPKLINYAKFTKDKKPKYKQEPIVRLFNSLGVMFTAEEFSELKKLDSMAQTRDAIAHGDNAIQITAKELKDHLNELKIIFDILEQKLSH
jgi:hypothetical protein